MWKEELKVFSEKEFSSWHPLGIIWKQGYLPRDNWTSYGLFLHHKAIITKNNLGLFKWYQLICNCFKPFIALDCILGTIILTSFKFCIYSNGQTHYNYTNRQTPAVVTISPFPVSWLVKGERTTQITVKSDRIKMFIPSLNV